MRPVTASNKGIIVQLVAPYDRGEDAGASSAGFGEWLRSHPLCRHARPVELRGAVLATCGIAGLVAGVLSLEVALGSVLALAGVCVAILRARVKARARAIERDLPALLTAVASSVRAGIDPLRALLDSHEYLAVGSPLGDEVRVLRQKIASGGEELACIEEFLSMDANRDVELFKRCLVLSRRHGSALAEPLHRVVKVVRQRQSFTRKTRAALAMHTMSALGIVLCAILIACIQVGMNPAGVRAALDDPRGVVLLSAGGALILIGVFWMSRMGREEAL
jgi:Flp pilus assembly protein TadB